MISGKQIKLRGEIETPKVNYREIKALNASMIKLFATDPVLFYKQFVLGEKKKDKKSTALIIGDISDFYILDCRGDDIEFDSRFEEKFALFQGAKGTGQVFILADELFDIIMESTDDQGVVQTDVADSFSEAFQRVQKMGKYKGGTEDKAFKDFSDNGYDYFKMLMENAGKTVVEVSLLDKSKRVAQLTMNDSFTEEIFKDKDEDLEYFPKFAIEWKYTAEQGEIVDCKSELDIMLIDHAKKIIYPKDLKTTYDNENFEYNYTKHRYDLQAAFYQLAVEYWKEQEGMADYTIEPMEFIVADTSINNRRPIRYQTSHEDLEKAFTGYSVRGIQYAGLINLIREIMWANSTGNWNVSKEVLDKNGKLVLKIPYDA